MTALLLNHALQIERLNPEIARATLTSSYGYYDPLLLADTRQEKASDSGGLDPQDFSRDAIYEAESQAVRAGLTGFLPSGMSYAFAGAYTHSDGTRNFFNFDSYNIVGSVAVRQPLLRNLWIDQGRLSIRVNKKNLKITELGVLYLSMDTINQVQQAYYELMFAHEDLRVQERLLQSREDFLAGIRRQVEVGMMTLPDEQLAQSQLAITQSDVISSRNDLALAENALKALLGESFTNRAGVPLVPAERLIILPEKFDLWESWERGLARRPDLAQLRQDLEKADIDLKYRRNQLFPSLDLIAGYTRRGASTVQVYPPAEATASVTDALDQFTGGDNPTKTIGVIFSLPLGLTLERGNYRTSKHLKAQAALLVKQKEEMVLREISDAIDTARFSLERVQATRRAVEYSAAALKAEERKLAGGKSTLFFVLQLQRDLATAQSSEVRAKANYNQALSKLRFAEGNLLEWSGLAVEFK